MNKKIEKLKESVSLMRQLAEWGIANEALSGNVVHLNVWKGQLSIIKQIQHVMEDLGL